MATSRTGGVLLSLLGACAFGMLVAAPALGQGGGFQDQVNAQLGLTNSEIVMLDLNPEPGVPVLIAIPIEGQDRVLNLFPYSIRGRNYQVLVQEADGLRPITPEPERTLRGELLDEPFSLAAGSMMDNGLSARISLLDGTDYWLQPIFGVVEGALPGMHVLYRGGDTICEGVCGTDDSFRLKNEDHHGNMSPGSLKVAELACDADVEYYIDYGSSVPNVENRINSIINTMNVQYERDVGITHLITTIIVRTVEPDPYSSSDAGTLLNQFRNHWQANHGSVIRDVAQLFTGRSLNGGTIGIAWVGSICTSNGYSVVENFTGNFSCLTDLSAHETGHSWNANHCSCPSYTMNPSITCANIFNGGSIAEITSFRDSRWCLSDENLFVDCPLASFQVKDGTLAFGNLASLDNSDDDPLLVESELIGTPQKSTVIVTANSPVTTVTQLDFSIELSADSGNVKTKIYLRNFDLGGWTLVSTITAPTTDNTYSFENVANPNNYLRNTDGRIQVRTVTTRNGTQGIYLFRIDDVTVSIIE